MGKDAAKFSIRFAIAASITVCVASQSVIDGYFRRNNIEICVTDGHLPQTGQIK